MVSFCDIKVVIFYFYKVFFLRVHFHFLSNDIH